MPDDVGKLTFTLTPEIEAAIKANLAAFPNVRDAIANLKKIGIDTSEHEATANGLETIMNALLATFGSKK